MTTPGTPPTGAPPREVPENPDLGFGGVVAARSRRRLLNRDGSFNVERTGLRFFESISLYHFLLTVTWPRFLALAAVGYVAINSVFAAAYVACGPGALEGPAGDGSLPARFAQAFFFSVQTLATIGYGRVSPDGLAANILVAVESLVGLLGFAVVAGIGFARFARPNPQVIFSRHAVVAPYEGITGFMFRLANARSSQLVEVEAKVSMSWKQPDGVREFDELPLERHRVSFFPLSWTVVHPIDAASPLHGWTAERLRASDAEFLILLSAYDETSAQTVHVRSSYKADEVEFGAKFRSILDASSRDGVVRLDIRGISDTEPVQR
ncbi:MAG: ion channel [Gemmatimonadales bacterium]